MDKNKVSEVLKYLEDSGWATLIDGRWKAEVSSDIVSKFPNLDEEVLNYVLNLVLVW